MKKLVYNIIILFSIFTFFSRCSLDEFNPSGVTIENAAKTVEGYSKLINNCYFDLPRYFYGRNLLYVTEGGTDIWTSKENTNLLPDYMKYGSGGAMSIDMAKDWWNGAYDGINSCNACIDRVGEVTNFTGVDQKNAMVAEAYFLRALYYFHLVEQFGPVVLRVHETTQIELEQYRTNEIEIYTQVIIPDLEFAAQYLPKTTSNLGKPTKKSALGLLAKACLQTAQYGTTENLQKALDTSKKLIDDVTAGGTNYEAKLYSSYSNNFPVDVKTNDEALYLIAYSQNYGSTNVYDHNNDFKKFYCTPDAFGGILADATEKRKVSRWSGGDFMPTKYLLDLFVMPGGIIDPRYAMSFQSVWTANKAFTWTDEALTKFDRTIDVSVTSQIAVGDTAICILRPEEEGYSQIGQRFSKNYIMLDIADIYENDSVRMRYTRVNRVPSEVDNPFYKFYPSLKKFNNGSQYQTTNTSRFTSDASAIVMRMGEIYLIAAEAEFRLNGATAAASGYINVLRERVYGAGNGQVSTSDISLQFILDERARELCGEYSRWYDLKRMNVLNKAYLEQKNPDVGKYFIDNIHNVRPIPQAQIDAISNPDQFQNPGY